MNGPRQVEIPPVVPGETLGQTLLNSLIGAANNARQMTGGDGINVSNIGGVFGISNDARAVRGDRQYLVHIQAAPVIAPGFYWGRIYSQPHVQFISAAAGSSSTPLTPYPVPNGNICFIVNLAEVNTAMYGSAGPFTAAPAAVTENRIAIGRLVGFMDSTALPAKYPPAPLIAVDIQTPKTTVPLVIADTVTMGGVYIVDSLTAPTGNMNHTGSTFSASTLGTTGASVGYFYNLEEMGKTTHDLASTASTATVVLGLAWTTNADGTINFIGPMDFPGCS